MSNYYDILWSKEVYKSNFRQYGQMEKQRWWEPERRRAEERRSEKRKSEAKGAQKGRKVAKHCVFPMICGSGGWKSRLAKAAGAEPCGQMRDEKLHAVVTRSTFPSQRAQNTPGSDHLWKLWCRKSARCCGAKHICKSKSTKHTMFGWCEAHFQAKMYKTHQLRTTFGSWDVEKVYAVVARSTFRSQNVKNTTCSDHFWTWLCALSKVSKTWGFCGMSKNDGRRGTFEEDLQRYIFRGRRNTRDICIRDVRRSGRWFPERCCILEQQIFSLGKMILRDRRNISYDLASLFPGRRNTLDRWGEKIAKRIGTKPSALHSAFHFWRKSCRIASFLMLSTSKIEEVSQNSFVLMLSNSKVKEVSPNCFVFKLAAG